MDHHKTIETMRETVAYMREAISALESAQEAEVVAQEAEVVAQEPDEVARRIYYPSDRLLQRLRQAVLASDLDQDAAKLRQRVLMAIAYFDVERTGL